MFTSYSNIVLQCMDLFHIVSYAIIHQQNEVGKENRKHPPVNAINNLVTGYKFMSYMLHTKISSLSIFISKQTKTLYIINHAITID